MNDELKHFRQKIANKVRSDAAIIGALKRFGRQYNDDPESVLESLAAEIETMTNE